MFNPLLGLVNPSGLTNLRGPIHTMYKLWIIPTNFLSIQKIFILTLSGFVTNCFKLSQLKGSIALHFTKVNLHHIFGVARYVETISASG